MDRLRPGDLRRVGPYHLERRLGAGGMGEVFLGRSPGGRPVVIKIIRPEHADDPQFRRRFAHEVEAARRVGGFHTAQVVDAAPDADPPWMVTAYIPGPSLHQAVKQNGPLPSVEVRRLTAGLAEGLAAIHRCGLVHRDLKPGNIIMAPDGPRIIDFGVARVPNAGTETTYGSVLGTYAYMSPEQVDGKPVTPASDVFSLGAVLAFAATGRSPFDADSIPAIVHRVTSGSPDLRGVPGELRELVVACLAQRPEDRPRVEDLITWFGDSAAISPDAPAEPAAGSERGASTGGADAPATPGPTRRDQPRERWRVRRTEHAPPAPRPYGGRRRVRSFVVAVAGFVLVAAISVAGWLVASDRLFGGGTGETGGAGRTAAAGAAAPTRVVRILPFDDVTGEPAPSIDVTDQASGECFSPSPTLIRADAWRCIVGSLIVDPCFTSPPRPASKPYLLCLNSASLNRMTRLNLTKPLPREFHPQDAKKGTFGGAVRLILANGKECAFVSGATSAVGDERLNFMCSDGGALYGDPDMREPVWTIDYKPKTGGRLEPVKIATVYQ